MGETRTVQLRFNTEFYDNAKRAAELRGIIFLNLLDWRFPASLLKFTKKKD